MKNIFTRLLGSLLLLSFVFTFAVANNTLLIYEDIDSNADGWIDRIEATQRLDLIQHWHEIDTDKDGVIGDLEYLRYEGKEMYVPPYDSQELDPGAGPL